MGIYGRDWDFELPDLSQLIKPLGFLAAAIIILAMLCLIALSFQPSAIEAFFTKNPLSLQNDAETLLRVKVTNVLESSVSPVLVEVVPVDIKSLHVFPATKTLTLMGSHESRQVDFLIKPRQDNDREVFPGSYVVKVRVSFGEQVFEEEVTLVLQ